MAKSDEKWVMFKQFMYNELGISKEDIQDWIKDAVQNEIEKRLNNTYERYNIVEMTQKAINEKLNDYRFRQEVLERFIADNYQIVRKK